MRRWSLVLFLTVTSTAAAQAPRITPAGDPSVQNDTIYRGRDTGSLGGGGARDGEE